MTVSELIKKLRMLPPSALVLVSGYESGLTILDAKSPRRLTVHDNGRGPGDYSGEYEEHEKGYCYGCEEKRPIVRVVVIER
jgi:hypothetical protein